MGCCSSSPATNQISKQEVRAKAENILEKVISSQLSDEDLVKCENSLEKLWRDINKLARNSKKIKAAKASEIKNTIMEAQNKIELQRRSRNRNRNIAIARKTDTNMTQMSKQDRIQQTPEECLASLIQHAQCLQRLPEYNKVGDVKTTISIIQSAITIITSLTENSKADWTSKFESTETNIDARDKTYSSVNELKKIESFLHTIKQNLQVKNFEQLNNDLKDIENKLANINETTTEELKQKEALQIFYEDVKKEVMVLKTKTLLDEAKTNHYKCVMEYFHSFFNLDNKKFDVTIQGLLQITKAVSGIDSKNSEERKNILTDLDQSLTVLQHEKKIYSSEKNFQTTERQEKVNNDILWSKTSKSLPGTKLEDSQISIRDNLSKLSIVTDGLIDQNVVDGTDFLTESVATSDYNVTKISKINRPQSKQSVTNNTKQSFEHPRELPKTVLSSTRKTANSHTIYFKNSKSEFQTEKSSTESNNYNDFLRNKKSSNDNVKRSSHFDEETGKMLNKKFKIEAPVQNLDIAKNEPLSDNHQQLSIESKNIHLVEKHQLKTGDTHQVYDVTKHVNNGVEQNKTGDENNSSTIFDMHQFFKDFNLKALENLDKPTQIGKIKELAEDYEIQVDTFSEDKGSIAYFVLDEKLMRLIEHLDRIKTKNEPDVLRQKIAVIEYIKTLHEKLDERSAD